MAGPKDNLPTTEADAVPLELAMNTKKKGQNTRFSLAYGFLVIMGGITVSTAHIHPTQSSLTLTREGVKLLARNGHFLEIPDDVIAGRSKANSIGKALICAQVLWMVLQCSVRAANGYPLALLEIHTIAHVVCAIVIYLLWWKKPLDVTVPVMVESAKFDDMLALILMFGLQCNQIWEMDRLVLWKPPTSEPILVRTERDDTKHQEPRCQENDPTLETSGPTSGLDMIIMTLEPGDRLSCGLELSLSYQETVTLTARDCKRWLLFAEAHSKRTPWTTDNYPVLIHEHTFWTVDRDPVLIHEDASWTVNRDWHMDRPEFQQGYSAYIFSGSTSLHELYLSLRASVQETEIDAFKEITNFKRYLWDTYRNNYGPRLSYVSLIFIALFPMIYGGVHLAARNFHFPSTTESTLWKIASIGITVFIPVCGIGNLTFWKLGHFFWPFDDFIGLVVALVLLLVFYTLARTYIVIEAFISLREAPLGVYVTTNWLQSIPHF